jgi:hypothetical protein
MADTIISRLLLGLDTREFRNGIRNLDRDLQGFSKNIQNLGGFIGATFAVGVIQDFTMEAIKLGDQLAAAQQGFERFGDAADLEKLKSSTKGMVSEVKLLQQAIQAGNFGIPIQELGDLFAFAQARARETGQEVDFLTQSIVTGIGRKSPLILDNLGISAIQLKERLGGVSAEAATIGDVTKAVAAIAKEELAKMGTSTLSATEEVTQFATEWEDFKADFGTAIAPAVVTSLRWIKKEFKEIREFAKDVFALPGKGLKGLADITTGLIGTTGGATMSKAPNYMELYQKQFPQKQEQEKPIEKTTVAIKEQGSALADTVRQLEQYQQAVRDLLEFNEMAPDYLEDVNSELFKGSDYWFTYGDRMAEALDTSALEEFMLTWSDTVDEVIPGIVNLSTQYERLNGVIGAVAGTIGNVLQESFTAALTNGEDFFKVFLDGLKKMALQLAATAGAALALSIILKSMGIGAGANIGQLFRVVGGQMGLPGLSGSSFNPMTGAVEGGLFGGRTTLRGNDIFLSNSRSGYDLGRIGG